MRPSPIGFGKWVGGGHAGADTFGLPGACSAGNESLPHCECGGRMRFDTDQIGRSMACCDRCERVLPLADVPDPVLD